MPKSKTIQKTSTKPQRTGGPGKLRGAVDGIPFGEQQQPSPEAKKLGWLKKKRGPELAQAILELAFKGMQNSQLKKAASEYFGIAQKDITVEMMLHFRQAEKAIQKAYTPAYIAVTNRAHGLPKQKTEVTGQDGKPIAMETKSFDYSSLPLELRKQILAHIRSDAPKTNSGE